MPPRCSSALTPPSTAPSPRVAMSCAPIAQTRPTSATQVQQPSAVGAGPRTGTAPRSTPSLCQPRIPGAEASVGPSSAASVCSLTTRSGLQTTTVGRLKATATLCSRQSPYIAVRDLPRSTPCSNRILTIPAWSNGSRSTAMGSSNARIAMPDGSRTSRMGQPAHQRWHACEPRRSSLVRPWPKDPTRSVGKLRCSTRCGDRKLTA